MIEIIITSIIAYFSTNLDYILLLVLLLGTYRRPRLILIGDLIGTSVLIILPMIIAKLLGEVPKMWLIGLLGIFPIFFGIKALFPNKTPAINETEPNLNSSLKIIFNTTILTITGCGADNIAVYIPIFIHKTNLELLVSYMIMMLMALSFFAGSIAIGHNKKLNNYLTAMGII